VPLPIPSSGKPKAARTLNYAASGAYVALSTDASLLEEYLRSSESQAKALRQAPGLLEAAQKVTGPATGLFGYRNYAEILRQTFDALKQESGAAASESGSAPLNDALGISSPETSFTDWMDFALLPSFDRVSKYFYFSVYGGSASVDGLTLRLFAPLPPQLKINAGTEAARK